MYFNKISCKQICEKWKFNKNTLTNIIKKCDLADKEALKYLKSSSHIPSSKLDLFDFLKHSSRKPLSNKRCLNNGQTKTITNLHKNLGYGLNRMYTHLSRQGFNMQIYTLPKIKGVYKRNSLLSKKKRTANGNVRSLYNYAMLEAFEKLQYDVKHVLDLKALPLNIYKKFQNNPELPVYQWTIIDAKTRVRFLAWSHSINSYFGFKFLELVIVWLRAHNVSTIMEFQFDGGREFCSASKVKLKKWNDNLAKYNVSVIDTDGSKWKQNIVERSHRTDDEEFYCPRSKFVKSKPTFLQEAQGWIMYFNNRSHMGLKGKTPKEELAGLGYYNADTICNFPALILEDFYKTLMDCFGGVFKDLSYYVLTDYPRLTVFSPKAVFNFVKTAIYLPNCPSNYPF
jgi:hypothetical protein